MAKMLKRAMNPAAVGESACGMIRIYGGRAEIEAEYCAEKHAARRDNEGRDMWLAIAAAIRNVQLHAALPVEWPEPSAQQRFKSGHADPRQGTD